MDDGRLCTLDELTELVGNALAVDYPGAPTARVRDVPDQRVIRWYITRGLVDRPVATRGRVALYGRRQLLQLVAIKRRQADGRSLAEIQAELAGATDETLAEVARIAPGALAVASRTGAVAAVPAPPALAPPGAARPASASPVAAASATAPQASATPGPRRTAFWADRPATATTRPDHPNRPTRAHEPANTPVKGDGGHAVALHGIRLAPGVTLLIEDGVARTVDVEAIQAAARPLLDLLKE